MATRNDSVADVNHLLRKYKLVFLGEQSGTQGPPW